MTVVYERENSGIGSIIITLVVAALLIFGLMWFIGQRHGLTATQELHKTVSEVPVETQAAASHAGAAASNASAAAGNASEATADLKHAGTAASSVLSKVGQDASVAVSEASEDIKAATKKQKQQEAVEHPAQ